jgi:hypothetical protein
MHIHQVNFTLQQYDYRMILYSYLVALAIHNA